MKILFIAPQSEFNSQIYEAIKKNGHEAVYINDRQVHFLPFGFQENIWRIVKTIRPLRRFNQVIFNKKALKVCKNFQPNAMLTVKGTMLFPETLAQMSKSGIKTLNWYPENVYHPLHTKWFLKHYADYDQFLIFDSSVVEKFSLDHPEKIKYIPFAIDPESFQVGNITDEGRQKYEANICFIGAPYPERVALLSAIEDLGLKIFGWSGWQKTKLARHYHGPLNAQESAKAYKLAKICINTNLEPPTYGVNVKTFEIPASGGFQLTDYRKDLDALFDIGREVAVFKDRTDLREKIKYYLEHDQERKNIARAGHERVLQDHTMDARVKQILNLI